MITLFENKYWKISIEQIEKQFRFRISHQDTMEITTKLMKFDKEILFVCQQTLKEIIKEIDKGKRKSKYGSIEILEDLDGQFDLHFINYSSEFQLDLNGFASDWNYL